MSENDKEFMNIAFALAQEAANFGEVPVGAVIVKNAEVLASARNMSEEEQNVCAHAEMLAIRDACKKLGSKNLSGCDLYVTLEPCPMCAAAISSARIRRVYFSAYDVKSGGEFLFASPQLHHKPEIYGGIEESRGAELMKGFFRSLR
jgi:tRNA(Arg) A34 adenosine deaminase TadA